MAQNRNELYHYYSGTNRNVNHNDELYHYYSGSVYAEDELYHYGVKGMKWGQKKLNRMGASVNKLAAKQQRIRQTKGVTSKAFRKANRKLNIAKAKQQLQKAKVNKDGTAEMLAKNDLKNAKKVKKLKDMNVKLTKNEQQAVKLQKSQKRQKLARVGSFAVGGLPGYVATRVGQNMINKRRYKKSQQSK